VAKKPVSSSCLHRDDAGHNKTGVQQGVASKYQQKEIMHTRILGTVLKRLIPEGPM
jgi:hypothetical protein